VSGSIVVGSAPLRKRTASIAWTYSGRTIQAQ
jgi:hypothetical protein